MEELKYNINRFTDLCHYSAIQASLMALAAEAALNVALSVACD